MAIAGYSGSPLAKRLSLKSGMLVWFDAMPESVRNEIDAYGLSLDVLDQSAPRIDAAHVFVTERSLMVARLNMLSPLFKPTRPNWVSWPKKAAKVATDIVEGIICAAILPHSDLVDVKVCAIDDVWSGLKLMIRKGAR